MEVSDLVQYIQDQISLAGTLATGTLIAFIINKRSPHSAIVLSGSIGSISRRRRGSRDCIGIRYTASQLRRANQILQSDLRGLIGVGYDTVSHGTVFIR